MPPNRIVALFTPVIAVAAGGAATWLADNVGLNVSSGELQAVFIAGLLAVLAPAAQWLHGFQKFEAHQESLDHEALAADEQAAADASAVVDDDERRRLRGRGVRGRGVRGRRPTTTRSTSDEDDLEGEYEAARDEADQPDPVEA